MKRSEVIDIIAYHLFSYTSQGIPGISFDELDEDTLEEINDEANDLLDRLENLGMTPPINDTILDGNDWDGYTEIHIREWDKE